MQSSKPTGASNPSLTEFEMARLLTLMRRAVRVASVSSMILENGWRPYPGMGRRELELAIDHLNESVKAMEANNDILPRRNLASLDPQKRAKK